MYLMSTVHSLLLCALAASLPGALGEPSIRLSDIRLNNSLMLNQKLTNKKLLLNINGPPLVNTVNELQSVFRDNICRNCTTCMERAIKAQKAHSHVIRNRPNAHELYFDVLYNNQRDKRNTVVPNSNDIVIKNDTSDATVTTYSKDGRVLAIEVKDTATNSCEVYSVKKSFACDAAKDLFSPPKRKSNKKNKKSKDKISTTTTTTTTTEKAKTVLYKKREVDNSAAPESFMPSIEELY